MEFLKKFGIGILYALFFPLLLVAIALIAVYGALTFIVEFIIMAINFFSGKKCFPVFEEDIEAAKRKEEALSAQAQPQPEEKTENKTNNVYVQQVYYNSDPNKMGFPNPMGNPFAHTQPASPQGQQPFNNQIPQSQQPSAFPQSPFQNASSPSPTQIPTRPTPASLTPPNDIQELLSRAEKEGDTND